MEFVLVLPIYILLFGALYLIGDMGLNAIRISLGDRDAAMDAGDRIDYSMGAFLDRQMGDEEKSKTSSISRTYRANENFEGSWSWQSAGRASFAYKLQKYGGGLVTYPFLRYGDASSGGGVLGSLVGGMDVIFHSKDFSLGVGSVRSYNYYTLKRTDLARSDAAYRNWTSDRLVLYSGGKQYWKGKVQEEDYADADGQKLDSSNQSADDTLPDVPSGAGEYKRYDQFVEWSE